MMFLEVGKVIMLLEEEKVMMLEVEKVMMFLELVVWSKHSPSLGSSHMGGKQTREWRSWNPESIS